MSADNIISAAEGVMSDITAQTAQLGMPNYLTPQILQSLTGGLYDLTTNNSQLGVYDVYGIKTHWVRDVTKLAVPIGAGPTVTGGAGCRVAVLGGPYGYKVVDWIVIREKFPPEIPAVEESTSCQLATSDIGAMNDCLAADNITTIYSRTGTYTYIVTQPENPSESDANFNVPWVKPVFAADSEPVAGSDFEDGMAPVEE